MTRPDPKEEFNAWTVAVTSASEEEARATLSRDYGYTARGAAEVLRWAVGNTRHKPAWWTGSLNRKR